MLKKEFLLQNKEKVRKFYVIEKHTVEETAKEFNCSTSVLQRFMREEGIKKVIPKKLEDLPSKEEVLGLLNSGMEHSDICNQLHITTSQLGKILEIGRFCNRVDESLISENSEITWYLLGIICSDGHNNVGNSIDIFQKDPKYLNNLKNLLRHEGSLYKSGTGYVLRINSKNLKNILNKYNISSDKRYSVPFIKAPTLELQSLFIRGLFDGDGCIYYNYVSGILKAQRIEITTGSKNMVKGIASLYQELGIHYTLDERISKAGNPYYVIYARTYEDIKLLGDWIYSYKFPFRLATKYAKYIKYLKLLEINAQIDNIVDAQGNLGTT